MSDTEDGIGDTERMVVAYQRHETCGSFVTARLTVEAKGEAEARAEFWKSLKGGDKFKDTLAVVILYTTQAEVTTHVNS